MLASALAAAALLAAAPAAAPSASPWDGEWVLDAARSSPLAKEGAADGYRFHLAAGVLRWEIPSLKEDFRIRLGGPPGAVRRDGRETGSTIGVRPDGDTGFAYTVSERGSVVAHGRMRLVDGGKAWVDLVWAKDQPLQAVEVVYRRKAAPRS